MGRLLTAGVALLCAVSAASRASAAAASAQAPATDAMLDEMISILTSEDDSVYEPGGAAERFLARRAGDRAGKPSSDENAPAEAVRQRAAAAAAAAADADDDGTAADGSSSRLRSLVDLLMTDDVRFELEADADGMYANHVTRYPRRDARPRRASQRDTTQRNNATQQRNASSATLATCSPPCPASTCLAHRHRHRHRHRQRLRWAGLSL